MAEGKRPVHTHWIALGLVSNGHFASVTQSEFGFNGGALHDATLGVDGRVPLVHLGRPASSTLSRRSHSTLLTPSHWSSSI